jgi:hypothetical protein
VGVCEERREDAEQEVVLQLVHVGVEPPVVLLPDSPDGRPGHLSVWLAKTLRRWRG